MIKFYVIWKNNKGYTEYNVCIQDLLNGHETQKTLAKIGRGQKVVFERPNLYGRTKKNS